MVISKRFTSRRYVFSLYLTSAIPDSPARTFYMAKSSPARLAGFLRQVNRMPRVGGLPCLACKCFNAFSKETYEKLALPG